MARAKSESTVTDALAAAEQPRQSVAERIERRREVLEQWLKNGIPSGKSVPKSLIVAREWDDIELGIFPISSPNEFTTTHVLHGRQVVLIRDLLRELKDRFKKPAAASPSQTKVAKFDRRAFDNLLAAAVSQWHTQRDQCLKEKKRADSAEARVSLLVKDAQQKDELIAELRQQLSQREGLRAVE